MGYGGDESWHSRKLFLLFHPMLLFHIVVVDGTSVTEERRALSHDDYY